MPHTPEEFPPKIRPIVTDYLAGKFCLPTFYPNTILSSRHTFGTILPVDNQFLTPQDCEKTIIKVSIASLPFWDFLDGEKLKFLKKYLPTYVLHNHLKEKMAREGLVSLTRDQMFQFLQHDEVVLKSEESLKVETMKGVTSQNVELELRKAIKKENLRYEEDSLQAWVTKAKNPKNSPAEIFDKALKSLRVLSEEIKLELAAQQKEKERKAAQKVEQVAKEPVARKVEAPKPKSDVAAGTDLPGLAPRVYRPRPVLPPNVPGTTTTTVVVTTTSTTTTTSVALVPAKPGVTQSWRDAAPAPSQDVKPQTVVEKWKPKPRVDDGKSKSGASLQFVYSNTGQPKFWNITVKGSQHYNDEDKVKAMQWWDRLQSDERAYSRIVGKAFRKAYSTFYTQPPHTMEEATKRFYGDENGTTPVNTPAGVVNLRNMSDEVASGYLRQALLEANYMFNSESLGLGSFAQKPVVTEFDAKKMEKEVIRKKERQKNRELPIEQKDVEAVIEQGLREARKKNRDYEEPMGPKKISGLRSRVANKTVLDTTVINPETYNVKFAQSIMVLAGADVLRAFYMMEPTSDIYSLEFFAQIRKEGRGGLLAALRRKDDKLSSALFAYDSTSKQTISFNDITTKFAAYLLAEGSVIVPSSGVTPLTVSTDLYVNQKRVIETRTEKTLLTLSIQGTSALTKNTILRWARMRTESTPIRAKVHDYDHLTESFSAMMVVMATPEDKAVIEDLRLDLSRIVGTHYFGVRDPLTFSRRLEEVRVLNTDIKGRISRGEYFIKKVDNNRQSSVFLREFKKQNFDLYKQMLRQIRPNTITGILKGKTIAELCQQLDILPITIPGVNTKLKFNSAASGGLMFRPYKHSETYKTEITLADILLRVLRDWVSAATPYDPRYNESFSMFERPTLHFKEEVYPNDKNIRAIYGSYTFMNLPYTMLLTNQMAGTPNLFHHPEVTSMIGYSHYSGGLDTFMEMAYARHLEIGEYIIFTSSDNWCMLCQVDASNRCIVALDFSKMEATHTDLSYYMWLLILLEPYSNEEGICGLSEELLFYMLNIAKNLSIDPAVNFFYGKLLQLPGLPSGVAGTFQINDCLSQMLAIKFKEAFPTLNIDLGKMASGFFEQMDTFKEQYGHKLTLEKFSVFKRSVRNPTSFLEENLSMLNTIIPLDLLGFDAFYTMVKVSQDGKPETFREVPVFLPVLSKDRLLRSLLFPKSVANSHFLFGIPEEMNTKLNHLMRLGAYFSLYIAGGFAHPEIRVLIEMMFFAVSNDAQEVLSEVNAQGAGIEQLIEMFKVSLGFDNNEDSHMRVLSDMDEFLAKMLPCALRKSMPTFDEIATIIMPKVVIVNQSGIQLPAHILLQMPLKNDRPVEHPMVLFDENFNAKNGFDKVNNKWQPVSSDAFVIHKGKKIDFQLVGDLNFTWVDITYVKPPVSGEPVSVNAKALITTGISKNVNVADTLKTRFCRIYTQEKTSNKPAIYSTNKDYDLFVALPKVSYQYMLDKGLPILDSIYRQVFIMQVANEYGVPYELVSEVLSTNETFFKLNIHLYEPRLKHSGVLKVAKVLSDSLSIDQGSTPYKSVIVPVYANLNINPIQKEGDKEYKLSATNPNEATNKRQTKNSPSRPRARTRSPPPRVARVDDPAAVIAVVPKEKERKAAGDIAKLGGRGLLDRVSPAEQLPARSKPLSEAYAPILDLPVEEPDQGDPPAVDLSDMPVEE